MSRVVEPEIAEKRWIHRDNVRAWVAVGIAIALSFALYVGIALLTGQLPGFLTRMFLVWDLFGLSYAALTVAAFRRADPDELPGLLAREGAQRSRWKRYLLGGGDGPGMAVTLAAVALGGAALLPRLETFTGPSHEGLLAGTLVVAVVMSWVVVVVSYAVHYARKNAENAGLRFPDEQPHGFTDYLYFSLTVATTFGTTDVDVTTTPMRRTVAGHSALTFLFNTVIIALLVTALTR
jgi:uncharacterized membrane protein